MQGRGGSGLGGSTMSVDVERDEGGFVDTLPDDHLPFSQVASSLYHDDELGDEDIEGILTTPPPHPLDFTALWRILSLKYGWDLRGERYCKPTFMGKNVKGGTEGVDFFSTKNDLVQYLCKGMGLLTYFNSRWKNMV
ncbi:hypothetical protein EON65_59340 [archaeon]|nr:MAG: hypothetical protein EON65_59340 [archaeon]